MSHLEESRFFELARVRPPADFVAKTTARYIRAFDARQQRRGLLLIAAALLIAPLFVIPMGGIVAGMAGEILHGVVIGTEHVVTVGHAFFAILLKLPPVAVAALALTSVTTLASSLLLGTLAVAGAGAK